MALFKNLIKKNGTTEVSIHTNGSQRPREEFTFSECNNPEKIKKAEEALAKSKGYKKVRFRWKVE